jgi:hypothetical protein
MNTATSSHRCTTIADCVRHSITMIQHLKCTTKWKSSGTVRKIAISLLSKQNYRVKYDLGRELASTMCFSETFLLVHWKI